MEATHKQAIEQGRIDRLVPRPLEWRLWFFAQESGRETGHGATHRGADGTRGRRDERPERGANHRAMKGR